MSAFGGVAFGSAAANYNPNKDIEVPSVRKFFCSSKGQKTNNDQ